MVTVVATAASMDLTTTQTGSTLQMDTLSAVPLQRNFNELIQMAPGTITGGTMGGASIAGASALENNFIIDGLDTTDYRLGFQGSSMPTDFIDQVEVQTGGFRPEFSALGGVVNAITKSGSNQFVGSAWVTKIWASSRAGPNPTTTTIRIPCSDRAKRATTPFPWPTRHLPTAMISALRRAAPSSPTSSSTLLASIKSTSRASPRPTRAA